MNVLHISDWHAGWKMSARGRRKFEATDAFLQYAADRRVRHVRLNGDIFDDRPQEQKGATKMLSSAIEHHSISTAFELAEWTHAPVVFGHTHRPGIYRRNGLLVGNSGSFVSKIHPTCILKKETRPSVPGRVLSRSIER
jgi:hypothetical protein